MRALALSAPAARLLMDRLPPKVAAALAQELEDEGDPRAAFLRWFNNPDFQAPLTSSAILPKGAGPASFTRATIRTATDHEGKPNALVAGEVGFIGARRVQNLNPNSGMDQWTTGPVRPTGYSVGGNATATQVVGWDGTGSACQFTATLGGNVGTNRLSISSAPAVIVGRVYVMSCRARRLSGVGGLSIAIDTTGTFLLVPAGTVTAAWQRWAAAPITIVGASVAGIYPTVANDVFEIDDVQWEDVTSQGNQNPGEYVASGATKLNEYLNTEGVGGTGWSVVNVVAGAAVAAYDGRAVGVKLNETAVVSQHTAYRTVVKPAAAVFTYLMQADFKAAERTWGALRLDDTAANGTVVFFDVQNGVMGSNTAIGAGFTVLGRGMRALGNGWYRCYAVFQTNNSANINPQIGCSSADATVTYLGVVNNGINIAYPACVQNATAEVAPFPVGNVYPYAGACVDGTQYFEFYNGNTVTNNVVVAGVGAAIGQTKNQTIFQPGLAGSYCSAPDSVANSITGDITIQAELTCPDWSPATDGAIVSKALGDPDRSWVFWLLSTGKLRFEWQPTGFGASTRTLDSSVAVPFADGTVGAVRVDVDVDNGAGGVSATFWTSSSTAGPWTQLGAVATAAGTTVLCDTIAPLNIGSRANGTLTPLAATFGRVCIYNGINGALAACFNPNDWAAGATFNSSATGETWTINGGAAIRSFPLYGYIEERATTNLVLQSENFGVTWTAAGTPTRTAAAKRCGAVALDLIGDDDAAVLEFYFQDVTYTGDAVKAFSFFFAQGTSASSAFRVLDNIAAAVRLLGVITWVAGVPTVTMTTGTLLGVDALADGTFRARCATTAVTAANAHRISIYPASDAVFTVGNTGNGYFGGVMTEDGLTCTSYIATTVATVTRNVDLLTYSALGNIVDAAGICYAEFTTTSNTVGNSRLVGFAGTVATPLSLAGLTVTSLFDGANSANSNAVATMANGAPHKGIGAWATARLIGSLDGGIGAPTGVYNGAMVGAATAMSIGCNGAGGLNINGTVRNVRIWKAANSDGYLQRATA